MLNTNLCVKCGDSITDPVCRGCYVKQTAIMLNDLGVHSIVSEIILKKVKHRFPAETLNDTDCILCKKEKVTLCRFCFSLILERILRELNFTEDLISHFEYNSVYEDASFEDSNILNNEMMIRY